MLDRIVGFLLALADLADRVADASRPVRVLVLWALQQADAVVKDFVAGSPCNAAGRHWSPAVIGLRYGFEPADAMALARSLRALARVVQGMAAQMRWQLPEVPDGSLVASDHDGRPNPGMDVSGWTLWRIQSSPAGRPDTS